MQAQTDLLGAGYDRSLNYLIGIVGTALAIGQLVDNDTATIIYKSIHNITAYLISLQSIWEGVLLPTLTDANKLQLLVSVPCVTTLLFMCLAWFLISRYLRRAGKRAGAKSVQSEVIKAVI